MTNDMTNEKAIEILSHELARLVTQNAPTEVLAAYRMAIKALLKGTEPDTDKRDCNNCIHYHEETCSSWDCKFKKKPTDDGETIEEARREAMRLDDNEDTLKWKGTH